MGRPLRLGEFELVAEQVAPGGPACSSRCNSIAKLASCCCRCSMMRWCFCSCIYVVMLLLAMSLMTEIIHLAKKDELHDVQMPNVTHDLEPAKVLDGETVPTALAMPSAEDVADYWEVSFSQQGVRPCRIHVRLRTEFFLPSEGGHFPPGIAVHELEHASGFAGGPTERLRRRTNRSRWTTGATSRIWSLRSAPRISWCHRDRDREHGAGHGGFMENQMGGSRSYDGSGRCTMVSSCSVWWSACRICFARVKVDDTDLTDLGALLPWGMPVPRLWVRLRSRCHQPGAERNHHYSFRSWVSDLVLWSSATEIDPRRQGPVAALQVQGSAKELVREMTPQQLRRSTHWSTPHGPHAAGHGTCSEVRAPKCREQY